MQHYAAVFVLSAILGSPFVRADAKDPVPQKYRFVGAPYAELATAIENAREVPPRDLTEAKTAEATRTLDLVHQALRKLERQPGAENLPIKSSMTNDELGKNLRRIRVAQAGGNSPFAVIYFIYPESGSIQYLRYRTRAEAEPLDDVRAKNPNAVVKPVFFDSVGAGR